MPATVTIEPATAEGRLAQTDGTTTTVMPTRRLEPGGAAGVLGLPPPGTGLHLLGEGRIMGVRIDCPLPGDGI